MTTVRLRREHLLLLALVVAPTVIAQGMRLLNITAPRAASASGAGPAVQAPELPVGAPSPAQSKASEWIASQSARALRDPFAAPALPEALPEASATQVLTAPDHAAAAPGRVPQFRLTGVIERGNTPLAAINGKVFRVGDEVLPGWTLQAVHGGERSVEIRHDDGRVVSVRVQPVEAPR